ncbi:hypothetical protein [Cytobacillus firmus]|uniref:hypothetical protein n=1 Tax=Cytobacillus firmus TaxID=1399 RepID=UPI0018CCB870|nr:hypothetical protein [Cytobacillus firmus]MBG9589828.1 hypothetical protein [Cytobacillus firmus]
MLFKTSSEKVIKLRERIEVKRQELHKKHANLLEDIQTLHEQKDDEFTQAILEDDTSYSDTKIRKSIAKANEELQDVRSQLQALDKLEAKQLEGLKGEVDAEFNKVRREEQARLDKHAEKIRLSKIEYLDLLIQHREEVSKAERRLREVNQVREQVGIKTLPVDMTMGFPINVYTGSEIHPVIMVGELRDAYQGRFPYAKHVKEKYSK